MESVTITGTSRDSARCDPVVLRETGTTRLVFKPDLVKDRHDARKPVKGTLIFQRKKPGDEWEDAGDINLASLKAGEGVQLALNCEEVDRLLGAMRWLYERFGADGIPDWKTVYK